GNSKDIEIQNLKTLLSKLQADYDKLKETNNSNIEKLKKTTIYYVLKIKKNQLKEDLNNLEERNHTLNLSSNKINVLEEENK
ncbi:hypothetical protein PIROE2DRAFT_1140, partial [Piromyces sp. E2]